MTNPTIKIIVTVEDNPKQGYCSRTSRFENYSRRTTFKTENGKLMGEITEEKYWGRPGYMGYADVPWATSLGGTDYDESEKYVKDKIREFFNEYGISIDFVEAE